MNCSEIAARIDHTLLKAEATVKQINKLIDEAMEHHFACVCVNSVYIKHVHQSLVDSDVRSCVVVGFPLGACTVSLKAVSAVDAVHLGADEIDIVAHLPNLLVQDVTAATEELQLIISSARKVRSDLIVKVIVESALLMKDVSPDQAERRIACACRAVRDAGADFIKTSTGFHSAGGATVDAVRLIAKHAGGLKIKASGGIRTRSDALAMLEAGAERLGCSAGVQIVAG